MFFDTALHPVREAYNRPRYLSFPGLSEELDRAYIKMFCCCSVAKTEKAMAPHSSTLAWKIPWTEELGRLQSMGSQSRIWLDDFAFTFRFHALEKEMATHSSVLPWRIPGTGEPGGLLSMGSQSQTRLRWLNSSSSSSSSSCQVLFDSFETSWTVAQRVPLSVGFPRQEYWSRLPFPSSGDLPNSGIKPKSPALAGRFFTLEPLKP